MLKLSPFPIFFHRVLQKCAKNLASLSDVIEETRITVFFFGLRTLIVKLLQQIEIGEYLMNWIGE